MNTYHYLAFAYFIINAFIAGRIDQQYYDDREPLDTRVVHGALLALFGSVLMLSINSWKALKQFSSWLEIRTQYNFFIYFYLTKKFDNMDEDMLYWFNNSANKKKDSKRLRDRIYCYATKLVNKRNNYTFKERDYSF